MKNMKVILVFGFVLVQVMCERTPGDVIRDFQPIIFDYHQKIAGIQSFAHSSASQITRTIETTISALRTYARTRQEQKINEINEFVNETIASSGFTREQAKLCLHDNDILKDNLIGDVRGGLRLAQNLILENTTLVYSIFSQLYTKQDLAHKSLQNTLDICGEGAVVEIVFKCFLDRIYLTNLPEINLLSQETTDGVNVAGLLGHGAVRGFTAKGVIVNNNMEVDRVYIFNNFDVCIKNLKT